jgi:hypothetical protein
MEKTGNTLQLLPPDDGRRDRDPREPFQPPPAGEPEEIPYDPTLDEPVDDPEDAPGRGEPEWRDPQPREPVRNVGSPREVSA